MGSHRKCRSVAEAVAGSLTIMLIMVVAGCGADAASPAAKGGAVPRGLDAQALERLDGYLAGLVDDGELAGAQILLARHDQIVFEAVFGRADLDAGTPVARDTLWRIYSMTKPVTSVAAMLLFEEGRFSLDDPLAQYLPEFADLTVLVDGETVAAERPITIRHVFTHSAGFSYGFTQRGLDARYREAALFASADLAEFTRRLATLPLLFEPGSRWHYGVSTDVLGRLVEVISGQALDRFLTERIFEPLAMVDTFFEVPADKLERFGTNHVMDAERGALRVLPDASLGNIGWSDVTLFSGGGGLVSTAADYMRFARMLQGGGTLDGVRLLSPKTVDWMTRDHLPAGRASATGVFGGDAALGFGLGFAVVNDPVHATGTVSSAGEYWWGGAAGTLFWIDPEEELIAVLMLQRMQSPPVIRRTVRTLVNAALD